MSVRTVSGTELHYALEPLAPHLGQVDRARLARLLRRHRRAQISMAACIKALWPGASESDAQPALRAFRMRLNRAAEAAEVGIRFCVDTKKRDAASERRCWFEVPAGEESALPFVSTARDYFAAHAPPAPRWFIEQATAHHDGAKSTANILASWPWVWADCMLEERNRPARASQSEEAP